MKNAKGFLKPLNEENSSRYASKIKHNYRTAREVKGTVYILDFYTEKTIFH